MKPDLIDAQSCIDWTVSKLPIFEERMQNWLRNNIEVIVREMPSDSVNDVLVAHEKQPLPPDFNVEAGAYINTIRSSLDILATAVGKRESVLFPNEIHFPIADNAKDFADGNYAGQKFVKQLSRTARERFEATKPYRGGNRALWTLHKFDIMRKHRRLLSVDSSPATLHVWGWGLSSVYTPVASGFLEGADGETILGLIAKGKEIPKLEFSPHITFNEPAIMDRCPVATALMWFADEVRNVITMFDY